LSVDQDTTFIETQLPVSKLSKESFRERKAVSGQTLTGLGKWWGRKPLIMVRAAILGLLMPASTDPKRDREVFLKILTMDDEGLWQRKTKAIPAKEIENWLSPAERAQWLDPNASTPKFRRGLSADDKAQLQRRVFERMSYDQRLTYCDRPEQIDGPPEAAWREINAHLGTEASKLPELVRQLGERRFGHTPKVGDAFCGGGSVPFEAARIGCEAYGSDLNPVAALLTWGALNIVGASEQVAQEVREAQERVFAAVDRQTTDWRIEHNAEGHRADAYLYCVETKCPECGWQVPLAPSWVIGENPKTRAKLVPDEADRRFDIEIHQGVSTQALAEAKNGTVRNSRLECPNPHCGESTPISAIRGDRRGVVEGQYGLRQWENADLVPQPDDFFQERLYCVRWRLPRLADLLWAEQNERQGASHPRPVPDWVPLETAIASLAEFLDASDRLDLDELRARDWLAEDAELAAAEAQFTELQAEEAAKSKLDGARQQVKRLRENLSQRTLDLAALDERIPRRRYLGVQEEDLDREQRVLELLRERFDDWQAEGFIPSRRIEPGDETTRLMRERGWTHWHHLFTPRQLLIHGKFAEFLLNVDILTATLFLLLVGRLANWDSKLTQWLSSQSGGTGGGKQTFANQALNTLYNFSCRTFLTLGSTAVEFSIACICWESKAQVFDARVVERSCDYWLTDPPYADAINYHELSEFFLAWYEKHLPRLFPDWYSDSKRALAIRGSGKGFREGMVDAYSNLAAHMPDNGLQIVMFTHQDAGVWADLALILWAAGLRVTAAWIIATETESALKEGNYVQGTVLMVLRKQTSDDIAFLDEIVPQVEIEVEEQLKAMLALDDKEDPNFSDADYQLAAYAAALRVLTQYKGIEDIDIAYELARERQRGAESPIERIIEDAVITASNFLVPDGIDPQLWKRLSPEEKLYLKCLEVESHGDYRSGVFQEFARGFGVRDYRFMLQSGRANQTRLKTAIEFKRRDWGGEGFGSSLLRHALFAVYQSAERDDIKVGLTYLKTELSDYWAQRENLAAMLGFIGKLSIPHWRADAEAARLLAGAAENDHV